MIKMSIFSRKMLIENQIFILNIHCVLHSFHLYPNPSNKLYLFDFEFVPFILFHMQLHQERQMFHSHLNWQFCWASHASFRLILTLRSIWLNSQLTQIVHTNCDIFHRFIHLARTKWNIDNDKNESKTK